MSAPFPSSTPHSELQSRATLAARVGAGLVLALFGTFTLMGLAGLAVLGYLAWQVPLTAEDLRHASWLSSHTTALHFSTGPMGYAFAGIAVLMGLVVSISKQTPLPAVVGGCMALALQLGMGEASVVRIGVLEGTIRIGCYVPQTEECRAMLGLPQDPAIRSMYPSRGEPASAFGAAPWYVQARKAVVSLEQEKRAAWSSIPGMAVLRAWRYGGSAPRLQALLAEQRAQVAQWKNESPPAAP